MSTTKGAIVKTILVGYDGSEPSDRALDRAIELSTQAGAQVFVLTAAEPTSRVGGFGGTRDVDRAELEQAHEALAKAQSKLDAAGAAARLVEAHGDAADMIVQVAQDKGADLIVVGHRGHNFAVRALLGSVATKVVNHSDHDVLVVH
jgi:nucleotide-binding universal stress UspA family protein